MNAFIFSLFIILTLSANVYSENCLHGEVRLAMVFQSTYLPSKFSDTNNVIWKKQLPGVGSSTPAIWGDKIFVTSAIDSKDGVTCFSSQEMSFDKKFGDERGKHKNGSGSNLL